MEGIWNNKTPVDVPHYENHEGEVWTLFGEERPAVCRCYFCGRDVIESMVFVHNEGCHSDHCIDCLEKIVEDFHKKKKKKEDQ